MRASNPKGNDEQPLPHSHDRIDPDRHPRLGAGAGAVAYSTFGSKTTTVIRSVPVGNSEPAAQTTPLTVGQVYRDVYRAIVEITVTSDQASPLGGQQQQRAQGSGFVVDSDGHIVTNDHVVDGAKSVSVQFWNGATYKASVVGADPSTDLGVIKVDAPQSVLHPIQFGNSDSVQVGDTAIAIGSPFGLEETVTSGIVSALHRQMEAPNNFTINDSIQTDAAINHGNSGGPLLNINGQVIGVNSQIRSDSGGSDGVGFAIPSNTVKSIADDADRQREGRARLPRRLGPADPGVGGRPAQARRRRRARDRQEEHSGREGRPQGRDREQDDRGRSVPDRRRRDHGHRRREGRDVRGRPAGGRRAPAGRHLEGHVLAKRRQPHGRREARHASDNDPSAVTNE